MFKRTLTYSDYFLIAANLLPVIGTWFLGWSATEVFVVYCLETIVVGIFNLIKMGIVTAVKKKEMWYNNGAGQMQSGIFFMFFFLVHYGFFVAIQTGIFVEASGIGKEYHAGFFDFFIHWPKYITGDAYTMLLGFFIGYGVKLVWDFIIPGVYKKASLMQLMFQPYLRIFIQQVTVILGSLFLSFGAGKVFVLIFAAIKIAFEVYLNFDAVIDKSMKEMIEQEKKGSAQ